MHHFHKGIYGHPYRKIGTNKMASIKWSASFRWSIGPDSAWGGIEITIILNKNDQGSRDKSMSVLGSIAPMICPEIRQSNPRRNFVANISKISQNKDSVTENFDMSPTLVWLLFLLVWVSFQNFCHSFSILNVQLSCAHLSCAIFWKLERNLTVYWVHRRSMSV